MNTVRPRVDFGQRGCEALASAPPVCRSHEPRRAIGRAACLIGLTILLLGIAGALFWILPAISSLNAESTQAEQRIIKVVNQPITHLRRYEPMTMYSPGWYHPGAITPNFNNVDIRTTQEFPYQGNVTSDLNPSEMFLGSELEFNQMTKYFYADRTLPKRRLSESEMVEINGLYRVIGRTKQAILVWRLETISLFVVGLCLGYALFWILRRVPTARSQ